MKIPLLVFGGITVLMGLLILGSIALSRFVRWLDWPADVLPAAGALFLLLAGLCLTAWRFGEIEKQVKKLQNYEHR